MSGPRCTCKPPDGVTRNHANGCALFDVRAAYRQGLASSPAQAGLDVMPCGYKFAGPGAGRCMQFPDHAIHHGAWLHREENHDYVAGPDRRVRQRRATSPPAGLDDGAANFDAAIQRAGAMLRRGMTLRPAEDAGERP